jgi:hypothetical protein
MKENDIHESKEAQLHESKLSLLLVKKKSK